MSSSSVLIPNAVTDEVVSRLKEAIGDEKVLTSPHERAMRAASCAPFPLHNWEEHTPDVVVLPKTTADVVAIVKLANEYRVPVVPRAGASGLADGAVPLHKGIVVDVKNMNEVLEIDEENMCVTVQTGINPLKLNEILEPLGKFHPDDLAGYANAMFGGRIGCGGWTLLGMGYGHVPDNVISMEMVLPTGDVMWVGEGGTKKIRKSAVGYRFKDLFMQHQGTLGIATTAVLELYPKPEVEFPAFFAYDSFADAHKSCYAMATSGLKTLSGVVIFDEYKVDFLRRDDEAWIPLPKDIKAANATIMYGARCEVEGASKRLFEIAKATGGRYLGRELSEGDWASRHDRYHLSYHGRRADGQVVLLSWHCEDSACIHTALPDIQKRWHEIAQRYIRQYDGVFDDWGMFMYTNNPFRGWGDYLTEIDIGVNELALTDETWAAWLKMKEEISQVTLENECSISACHGGCRPGDVDLAMHQEMGGGQFELMKKIKRMLDPNNVMNPGKYLLNEAYEEQSGADRLGLSEGGVR